MQRKWTDKQRQEARERALLDCHRELLGKIVSNPALRDMLADPNSFRQIEHMARGKKRGTP